VDPRLEAAPVVAELAQAVSGLVAGLYVGGSLATGDYRPGVSDIDGAALLDAAPRPAVWAELTGIHQRLAREFEHADALHCVYVSVQEVADVTRTHWTWAFGELFRRPLSRITRAELLADPIVVFGPPPSLWLPPMGGAEFPDAARAELAGYWTRALRKRALWLQDVYVDLGLTVWARADATISEGILITKAEAIARMAERGVPPDVVDGVARRREGQSVVLSDVERNERAVVVRQFLKDEFARLLTAP
jgi:nucleotidyltransferase-like protein